MSWLLLTALVAGPTPPDEEAWGAAGWGEEAGTESESEPESEPESEAEAETEAETETETETEAESEPEFEPKAGTGFDRKTRVGDWLSGSLRLNGAFLHFPDEPLLYPDGDDALGIAVGRILVEADASEHVHVSVNGFGELSRIPVGGGFGGSFASAGSTSSAYRTRFLTWQFWNDGSVGGQVGADRLGVQLSYDPVKIDIGRLPISYSVTGILSTNDFFAPFSATAVNRIYKPGVDAVRMAVGVTPSSTVESVGALGYDPETDVPSWGRSAVLSRVAFVAAGYRWEVLGGKVSQRWVAGGSLQGDLGPVNLRAEFHAGFPDEEGNLPDRTDRPTYGRVVGGLSKVFVWHNAQVGAEYMFASDGARDPDGYVDRALARYSDDLPYLGRHYVGVGGGFELIPIVRLGITSLVSAGDGSGLAGVSVQYNVANESDMFVGLFVPWGRGLRNIDPMTGLPSLGSEFGLAPLSAYLESRVFF